MNFPPSRIGNGNMLIIPMKNEIIHNHNKNIETVGSFHSMKFITGLYVNELSLIIPINPLSGSSGAGITSNSKFNGCPSLSTETVAVSPGFKLGKSAGIRIGMSLIEVIISFPSNPACSAPEFSIIESIKTPSGNS